MESWDTKSKFKSRLTLIDCKYESCYDTYSKFIIYTKSRASQITEFLKIEPSECVQKGDTFVNSLGRRRTAPNSYWLLSSENHIQSKDVRDHMSWLIAELSPHEEEIRRLQQQQGIEMSINSIWWSKGTGGPTIWPEQMEAFARLNLELSFDVYFID
ncbi:DUF4279 domain-containing protein [Flexibacterium corallicola]|uniref:DUF4279 domain-containing protein n=1 Tax=Flexibacterium corallicola TaxID=3037259 RepID=UPI00286F7FF6|nr:DUF4279 domain-containing protein [Pseudovibrio sp. M1P-2-3]